MTDDQPPPAPRRRDDPSPAASSLPCDCGGCREFRAITLHARRELDLGERVGKRSDDRREQRRLEEAELEQQRAAG